MFKGAGSYRFEMGLHRGEGSLAYHPNDMGGRMAKVREDTADELHSPLSRSTVIHSVWTLLHVQPAALHLR